MPHCVILYTPNLETKTDVGVLCRKLADTMLTIRDEAGKQVFPTGGTRVLAYPAAHYAVAAAARGKGEVFHMKAIPIFAVTCTAATMTIA